MIDKVLSKQNVVLSVIQRISKPKGFDTALLEYQFFVGSPRYFHSILGRFSLSVYFENPANYDSIDYLIIAKQICHHGMEGVCVLTDSIALYSL